MKRCSKVLVWLSTDIKTPPFSVEARREAGRLLRDLQDGEALGMPVSRPMPTIGANCHELRIRDLSGKVDWRVAYRIDTDAIVILEIFMKKTQATPEPTIELCRRRLRRYLAARS